jgi:hypothetical protein
MGKKKKAIVANGTTTLVLNGITVIPVAELESAQTCHCCCFSFEGRAQRDCPSVSFQGTTRRLCTTLIVGVGNSARTIYFKEKE